MIRLPALEYLVLEILEPGRSISVAEIATKAPGTIASLSDHLLDLGGMLPSRNYADQALIMAGLKMLSDRGFVAITETDDEQISLVGDGGLEAEQFGLPERDALNKIVAAGGAVGLAELPKLLGKKDTRTEMKWLLKKGWCTRDTGLLVVTEVGRRAHSCKQQGADEWLIWWLRHEGGETVLLSDLLAGESGATARKALALLRGREDVLRIRKRVRRTASLTDAGAEAKAGELELAREVTQLTPDLLVSGKWQRVIFKAYDPSLATAPMYPGKEHPLQRVIQEIRRTFFEMGFEEVASPAVDTAFWVFDALFQPQDHPAREMQDTFYMAEPKQGKLPDDALVQTVARTHEDGGDTGSTGWRYKWDPDKARQLVLRTHTTAASIRALAANPKPPRKVFCIGKTFRRENMDQTHLAEFMQIDGIIIDKKATLATLFGTLEAFYKKMGAEEVRFRPSFFPYTEPSAEVFAKMGDLGWVEMCGAGVFRPEVTEPLGCKAPVLAWGGGVERIAMLRFGLDDIRKLYLADIDWLKAAKLGK